MIVGLVGVALVRPAAPPARWGAHRREVIEQRLEHQAVVGVGSGHQQRQRQPAASTARCSLDPRVARSTGFAPVRSPPDRPQAEGVHADPRPVQPTGLAQLVQQQLLEPLEHPGVGPLGNRRQQVVTLPQPNSPTGSSAHGVEVRAMKMIAAMHARSARCGAHRRGRGRVAVAAAAGGAARAGRAAGGRPRWSWPGRLPAADRVADPAPSSTIRS